MIEPKINLENTAVTTDIAVRFAETDAMGVVHHSAYIIWFECGRVAWMAAVGMPYSEIAAQGNHFAVTGIHVAYRASARFGDTVRVVTQLVTLRSRQIEFSYAVRSIVDDRLLATGVSEHVCVDLDGRMTKIPPSILARLQQGAARLIPVPQ